MNCEPNVKRGAPIRMAIRKFTGIEDELHEAATRKTGLVDFGDSAYRQGLRVLLDAYDTDIQVTQAGWQYVYDTVLLGTLTARLYTQKGWATRPEVLAIPIQRPLVITGLPRTGTTALHKLLSMDQRFQGLEYWLAQEPMMRPPRETWEANPAYRTCVANLEAIFRKMPEFRKAHDMVANEVDECGAVLSQSFKFSGFSTLLPTYDRWYLAQSVQGTYRRYMDILRLIGAREPHKTWLLKDNSHMIDIDTLFEVLPDACIIQTHRDPLKAIPSFCSLVRMLQWTMEGEGARPNIIGPWQCAYWRMALDRTQAARQKFSSQFFDVDHRCFVADPLGTVRSIYEYFGYTLSAHAEQQMRAWVAASPTTRHGEHHYTIDPYGITQAEICATFADYRAEHQFN